MARNTVHGGVSDMAADRVEARRNLASQGNTDPSAADLDAEIQRVTDQRAASAHLEQGAGTVTPEHQAAKTDDGAGDGDASLPGDNPDGAGEYDPSAHTVEQVNDYLAGLGEDAAGDAERERVLDAEEAGKARVGILGSADA